MGSHFKAISLHQPWATFIALGWKRVETRSWATSYQGPLAIHAAKTTRHLDGAYALAGRAGMNSALLPADGDWPLGAVVAVVRLAGCSQVHQHLELRWRHLDMVLGDLSPGRFGWRLEDCRRLATPVRAIGRQGFWTLDEQTTRAVVAQLEPTGADAGVRS